MAMDSKVRVPDHVLARSVDNDLVLLNLDNEHYYGLDEVGATMWDAVTKAETVAEAVQALLALYEIDADTLQHDVENLLTDLQTRGLVEFDPS